MPPGLRGIAGKPTMLREKLALIVGICTRHAWAVIAVAGAVGDRSPASTARAISRSTPTSASSSRPTCPGASASSHSWRHFPSASIRFSRWSTRRPPSLRARPPRCSRRSSASRSPSSRPWRSRAAARCSPATGCCSCRPRRSEKSTAALAEAKPVIHVLHSDPSLRGLVQALAFSMAGVQVDRITLDDMARATEPGRRLAGERARRPHRELFLARVDQRQAVAAHAICGASSRSGRSSTTKRSSPESGRPTRSARPRPISISRPNTRRGCG